MMEDVNEESNKLWVLFVFDNVSYLANSWKFSVMFGCFSVLDFSLGVRSDVFGNFK